MRLQPVTRPLFMLRLVAVAVTVLATALASGPRPATADQSNIAYDEVTKFVRGDQPAPQPGTFTADFQAAVNAASANANQPQHHGMFGSMMNALSQAKNAMSIFTTGSATRYFYMNGWERTEDVANGTATIMRPDRHEIIYLDLNKKTYRTVDTNVTPVTETAPPAPAPAGPQAPEPSPQPGTGKVDVTVSSTSLGPKTIENVATNGYDQDFKMTSTQSTGSCRDGSFETEMVEYLSSYAEPHLAPTTTAHYTMSTMPSMPHGAMPVHPGCNPTFSMHTSGGASAPAGRLSLWSLMTLKGSAQTQSGPAGGGFSTLTERGDVRTLGGSDAALFDVPAGFTQEGS
jgi:hypothetical protein